MPASTSITPLGSIVVATDFSRGSRWALRRAALLPLAPRARVLIAHVIEGAPSSASARRASQLFQRRLERLAAGFARLARARGCPDVRVETMVEEGRPFVRILRLARRRRAELIVLGGHGKRTVRDLLLGTTAQRVVRKSSIPVLVVKSQPAQGYRRCLVAVDLESSSPYVARTALRVLGLRKPDMVLLHACHLPFEGWVLMREAGVERQHYRHASVRQAAERLKTLREALRRETSGVTAKVRYGDPRNVILEEVTRWRPELVVAGSHSRSGLAEALLGQVADWITRVLPCDVLVARVPGVTVRLP